MSERKVARMKKVLPVMVITTLALSLLATSAFAAGKNPYGTSEIDPAGPYEVILTISKAGKRSDFASSRLAKFKSSQISIYEPFVKRRERFTVIPIATFFSLVGIKGRDKVVTRALNDYTFTATANQFLEANAYLAIALNGEPIGYDQGGPIRLVFPDTSKWAKNLDAWNWSLRTISVK